MALPSPHALARFSRDRRALVKAALAILAVSLVLAFAVSALTGARPAASARPAPGTPGEALSWIRFGAPSPTEAPGRSCFDLRRGGWPHPFAEAVEAALEDAASDPATAPVRHLWIALVAGDFPEGIRRLESLDPSLRHRQECLGDLRYLAGDTAGALLAYLAEAERFPEARYARRSALRLARYEEDREGLRNLLADPSFLAAAGPTARIGFHAWLGDQAGLARSVLAVERDLLLSPFAIPALFTAAIWFLVLLSFRAPSPAFRRLCLLAFALGIASATLTLHAAVVQEEMRGFRFDAEASAMDQFLHFLAGVALREEVLKLLCFAPLAFALRRRGTALEALVLAGMTGLGFAFQENLAYYQSGAGTFTAWVRLLTANALHFSLTGVAGHALWRMLHRRLRGWEEFLLVFLAVVFAHALYNSLLSMPALEGYSPLAPILVAVIAYQYFDPLRQHLDTAGLHRRLSPLGIFVMGSALLTCAILVGSAAAMPFRFALGAFASSVAAMVPLAFAFIGRFRDL